MLLAPHRVASGRVFVDFLVLVREDEPDVDVRVLLLDQQMLGPISHIENPFGFAKEKAALFGQLEVR